MKKIYLLIVTFLFLLIPSVVLADVGAQYYTGVYDNNGNVGYVVRFTSLNGQSKNVTTNPRIYFDSDILEYVSAKEYTSKTNAKINVSTVKKGVLDLKITSTKDFNDYYDVNVIITFKLKSKKSTQIKLESQYQFDENCKANKVREGDECDPFYLGEVDNLNATRTVSFDSNGKIVRVGDSIDVEEFITTTDDTPKEPETTTEEPEKPTDVIVSESDTCTSSVSNELFYASIIFNVVLLICTIYLFIKNRKQY